MAVLHHIMHFFDTVWHEQTVTNGVVGVPWCLHAMLWPDRCKQYLWPCACSNMHNLVNVPQTAEA